MNLAFRYFPAHLWRPVGCLLVLTSACLALPQSGPETHARVEGPAQPAISSPNLDRLGLCKGASVLIGRTVCDQEEMVVGQITDILLAFPGGQALGVALQVSNRAERVLVPAGAFKVVRDDRIVVAAEGLRVRGAPAWVAGSVRTADLNAAFEWFGRQSPLMPASSTLVHATRVLGMPLVSSDAETLGQVREVMVDVTAGRVVYVVCAEGNQPGARRRLLPPAVIRAADGRVTLSQTAARYQASPVLHPQFPVEMYTPEVARRVYQFYGAWPEDAVTTDSSDRRLADAILRGIASEGRVAGSPNVMVVAEQGRVRLEGSARDNSQAREVLRIAEQIAGPGNVQNNLVTVRTP